LNQSRCSGSTPGLHCEFAVKDLSIFQDGDKGSYGAERAAQETFRPDLWREAGWLVGHRVNLAASRPGSRDLSNCAAQFLHRNDLVDWG